MVTEAALILKMVRSFRVKSKCTRTMAHGNNQTGGVQPSGNRKWMAAAHTTVPKALRVKMHFSGLLIQAFWSKLLGANFCKERPQVWCWGMGQRLCPSFATSFFFLKICMTRLCTPWARGDTQYHLPEPVPALGWKAWTKNSKMVVLITAATNLLSPYVCHTSGFLFLHK